MQPKSTTAPQAAAAGGKKSDQAARVAEQVIRSLGRPNSFQRVDVRHLWQDHCRANVLVGPDPISLRIAHSYFLKLDTDGNVITSTPQITKLYCA